MVFADVSALRDGKLLHGCAFRELGEVEVVNVAKLLHGLEREEL